uniref:Zinc finger CHCC-type domain-containing protein n=1 Tax=Eucampia antarctica TaxID=49252 RepID=A0A7S2S1L5_9STRA|mmetsp:Transcript_29717/g.28576  ORF Transcript_29717/g.28576 Transcript_29717/m.28576 type:complete len:123 (+) Transcript_29717:44-412(+)|eukprot:CAMPEP_0197837912 /NCGR_PEP_ID=MMETSP1437-20131217/33716_1 /TAXON_ID=49252 ORGANISM="Eucampia antarctica, Strain CCMP1452" /NCGR_SAMPLE_ID=MMETSP1437 /ASSEMBLY_ACC=CAM_ASM_001096 /LENGTH=122 /DNA_ID=CAMNT_0043445343 /DNA_START=38 /DNA_END=406 /DNA_ORIENTATION=+
MALLKVARNISKVVARNRIFAIRSMTTSNDQDDIEKKRKYYITRQDSPYALGKHRSNALELLERQPIVEVDGPIAVCDGGGGALGHPLEYIKLTDLNEGKSVVSCVYCGIKYRHKKGSAHHH